MNSNTEYITIKPSLHNRIKNWCFEKITEINGELPEIEIEIEKPESENKKSILKKSKTVRYIVFPIVFILIIIDESYIRFRDCLKKMWESE